MSANDRQRSFCNNGRSKSLATALRQQDWPGLLSIPANLAYWVDNLRRPRRLAAAETPEAEAAAAAAANAAATAAAATATAAAATPAPATSAPATAATATPRHLLQGAAIVFLVEQMECRQADVRNFLFTQRDRLRRREVGFLRDICSRRG
jgi:hypothetical protein